MKKHVLNNYVTAIDIGTTKICVLIACLNNNNSFDIVGIGQHPSFGMKKGVIVDIRKTVDSIKQAVAQAEAMAGIKVDAATVGISGGHIQSYNSTGVVAIKNKDVSQQDIDRVIEAAKAIPLPPQQEILHVLPQYFRVDGQEYILDSLGMYGVRLEAQVHIITGSVASAQNIVKSCELAGVRVVDIILEQLASAQAVLTKSESEIGAGIIDIGGGTSDFAIYKDGRIRHSKVLPLAGNHFTNDVSIRFGIPSHQAENLKKLFGIKNTSLYEGQKMVHVDLDYQGGQKEILLNELTDTLFLRAEEIFELFAQEMHQYNLHLFMPAGLVLTGGGSLLADIDKLAQGILNIPVRVGYPHTIVRDAETNLPDALKSPIYATAYGLLLYATGSNHLDHAVSQMHGSLFSRIFTRMKSWIYDFL